MKVKSLQVRRVQFVVWLVAAAIILAFPRVTSAVPIQAIAVTVISLYDGARVGVAFGDGGRETLRLKGIEVPPCLQAEAIHRTRELIQTRVTFLELSSTPRDGTTNELAGYLWADSVMVNLALVSEGYAFANSEGSRYDQNLKEAGRAAQARGTGVYARVC